MAILDNDGNRILAKYYDDNIFPTIKEQKAFEKNLFNRTHRANAEIIMLDGITCLYKSNVDLFFYVMGSSHENEVCLSIVSCILTSIHSLYTLSGKKVTGSVNVAASDRTQMFAGSVFFVWIKHILYCTKYKLFIFSYYWWVSYNACMIQSVKY